MTLRPATYFLIQQEHEHGQHCKHIKWIGSLGNLNVQVGDFTARDLIMDKKVGRWETGFGGVGII